MGWESKHNVINSRFKTEVADTQSVTTFYDNFPASPPDDSLWVNFTISQAESIQVEIGGNSGRFRQPGIAIAQLFAPVEAGTKDIKELADVVAASFRAVTDAGVTFRSPWLNQIGRVDQWWQMNVICPFYYDEVV